MEQKLKILINTFNQLFEKSYSTILVPFGDEPVFLPKDEKNPLNRVIFRSDFTSSALHEISHRSLAGTQRRKLMDFGYWYNPDGRNEKEQRLFEQVEIKPQALEWILSDAFKHKFNFSYDNLEGELYQSSFFEEAVKYQKGLFLSEGLPKRAEILRKSLLGIHQEGPCFAI